MSGHAEVTTNTEIPYLNSYRSYFTPTDESIPYRLVGSYEYLKALDQFTKLLSISSSEELKIYDTILNDRAEFSFVHGVRSAFEELPDLTKATKFERSRFDDEFLKRGLPWMMALARIELAATSSLYGKIKEPFEAVATSEFDAEAYLNILKDDVLAHMKSLAQEPGFKEVLRRSRKADTWTLAYLRRIKLIRDMLQTLQKVGSETIQDEIEPLAYELKKHQRNLIDQVRSETVSSSDVEVVRRSGSSSIREGDISKGQCDTFITDNFGPNAVGPETQSPSAPSTGSSSGNLVRTGGG